MTQWIDPEVQPQGSPRDATVPQLVEMLGSSSWSQRREARERLAAMGPAVSEELVTALTSGDGAVRWEAAKTLGEIRDPATAAALTVALEDENSSVRWAAGDALIALGRPALVPLLRRMLQRSDSGWYQESAHRILQRLVTKDLSSILSPLINALESQTPDIAVVPPLNDALKALEERR